MNHNNDLERILADAGIRPTSNRVIVLRALRDSHVPMSLTEIETEIDTLDKSSVFRVLTTLLSHHLVHAIEDGRGIVKYEMCHSDGDCSVDDMHVHFYCEKCHNVYCFEDIGIPPVHMPEGYKVNAVNYMIKGICPRCQA